MAEHTMIRRIATRVERPLRAGDETTVRWACRLAARTGASVETLAYETAVLTAPEPGADASFAAAREQLAALGGEAGVALRSHDRPSYADSIGETFASLARLCDTAVLGAPEGSDIAFRMIATASVFDGAPTILLPHNADPDRQPLRILVGWKPGAPAARALKAAIALAGPAGELLIVQAEEANATRAQESGLDAAQFAAAYGVHAVFQSAAASKDGALPTLLEAADGFAADLLALGAVRHGPLHRALFGSTTNAVLDAPVRRPLLLAG
jgi:nucleotide-binding universal stress UspA family protein